MKHPDDQTLLLYRLGELTDEQAREVRLALQDDPALRAQLDELDAMFNVLDHAGIPKRDENYGRRVWARVEPELRDEPFYARLWQKLTPPVLAGAAVVVIVISVSFYTPEITKQPELAGTQDAVTQSSVRDRVLLASVSKHLEGSQRLIMEFTNRLGTEVNTEEEREWADILLMANRLYRFAAEQAGQPRIAQLLADMEPVLIELANNENGLTNEEFNALRQRISDNDLIFRMRGFKQGMAL